MSAASKEQMPLFSATKKRAQYWLSIRRNGWMMFDYREEKSGTYVDTPIEQWEMLYHDTLLECMN